MPSLSEMQLVSVATVQLQVRSVTLPSVIATGTPSDPGAFLSDNDPSAGGAAAGGASGGSAGAGGAAAGAAGAAGGAGGAAAGSAGGGAAGGAAGGTGSGSAGAAAGGAAAGGSSSGAAGGAAGGSSSGSASAGGAAAGAGAAGAAGAGAATVTSVSLASAIRLTPVRATATPLTVPPALVLAASTDAVDVDFQKSVSNEFSLYIANLMRAIVLAHDAWRAGTYFVGVTVNGPIARGGRLVGPDFGALIVPNAGPLPRLWGRGASLTQAVADGLGSAWDTWQQSITIPGLVWYPSLTAVAARQAPPTANIPTPLASLTMSTASLRSDQLFTSMMRRLVNPVPMGSAVLQCVATAFAQAVSAWLSTQQVTNVMGVGPVPSMAPPYVPVGPVNAGTVLANPGALGS